MSKNDTEDDDASNTTTTQSTIAVIDSGSHTTKAGFASEPCPRCVFPTVIAHNRMPFYMAHLFLNGHHPNRKWKSCYVGHEANEVRGICGLRYPVENGIVTNWDQMQKVWEHALFDQLSTTHTDHHHQSNTDDNKSANVSGVLLTEKVLNPRSNREKML